LKKKQMKKFLIFIHNLKLIFKILEINLT
jgi:hypothetical protein